MKTRELNHGESINCALLYQNYDGDISPPGGPVATFVSGRMLFIRMQCSGEVGCSEQPPL